MPPSDGDLWRLAKRLVDVYGDDAEAEAARRADAFRAAGDTENADFWNRIFNMVAELLGSDPENDQRKQ
jgi:hypothetical protein